MTPAKHASLELFLREKNQNGQGIILGEFELGLSLSDSMLRDGKGKKVVFHQAYHNKFLDGEIT